MNILRSLMLGVATGVVLVTGISGAVAAEINAPYVAPNIYSSSYGFEGFYAGVLLGGMVDGTSSYLTAPDTSALNAGLAVGVNFYITDSVVGGVEVQASGNFGATATVLDALALARVGFAPNDDFMVYGAAGAGVAGGSNVYAFGGGVEVSVMNNIGVRGEILGLGAWGAAPDAAKATVGLIWHMQ